MKKLCRFYCKDCDNAWLEILSIKEEENVDYADKCDYCGKKQEAEDLLDNEKNY
jgi:hypothetical protein